MHTLIKTSKEETLLKQMRLILKTFQEKWHKSMKSEY